MVSNRLTLTTATAALASSLLLFSSSTFAQSSTTAVTPTAPGPGEIFTAGGQCSTTWTPASSNRWSNMTIELMTGSNQQMTSLAVLASGIDGTSSTQTTFTYTCPEVTLYSAVYFYQYTRGNEQDPTWTTRFMIQSADGESVSPPFTEQASGETVYWGIGALAASSSDEIQSGSLAAAQGTNAGTTTVTATGPSLATDTSLSSASSSTTSNGSSGMTTSATSTPSTATATNTSSTPTATSTNTSGASAQIGKIGGVAFLVMGGALAVLL